MLVAPSTTWLLVRISPLDVRTIPVPAAAAFWYWSTVSMVTMPTCSAAVAVVVAPVAPVPSLDVPPDPPDKPPPYQPKPRPEPGAEPAGTVCPTAGEAVSTPLGVPRRG